MRFGGLFEELEWLLSPKDGAAGFIITMSMLPADDEEVTAVV